MQQHSNRKGLWSQQKLQQFVKWGLGALLLFALAYALRWETIHCGEGWCLRENRWTGVQRVVDVERVYLSQP